MVLLHSCFFLACQSGVSGHSSNPLESAHGGFLHPDLAYGPEDAQRFDLYLPDTLDGSPFPLVIFFHAGGFTSGSKDSVFHSERKRAQVRRLLENGIAVINAEYRLIPDHPGSDLLMSLNDGRRMIEFLLSQADSLSLNAGRIALWGNSAGAGIALWNGLQSAELFDAAVSDPIRAIYVNECQAGYDPRRWLQQLETAGVRPVDLRNGVGMERFNLLFNSPGLEKLSELYVQRDSILRLVDIPVFMDVSDPPVWFRNLRVVPEQAELLRAPDLLHHPLHIEAFRAALVSCCPERSGDVFEESGMGTGSLPHMDGVDFLIHHLLK